MTPTFMFVLTGTTLYFRQGVPKQYVTKIKYHFINVKQHKTIPVLKHHVIKTNMGMEAKFHVFLNMGVEVSG
jgi:hypothetical protein